MKQKSKLALRVLSVVLSILMLASVFSVPALAEPEEVPASGTSGSCTWTFDKDTGTLTISGNGAMGDDHDIPYAVRKLTTVAVIEEGVTTICRSAFSSTKITEVTIPSSVKRIDEYAFDGCSKLLNRKARVSRQP